MKLYTRGRYALRMMVAVARRSDGADAVSLGTLAAATMISRRYLEQVARRLREQSLLRAVSGRSGGYILARPPEQITVAEIVEASIGPISVVDCIRDPDHCLEAEFCECRWVYQQVNSGILAVLDGLTLDVLASRGSARQGCRDYPSATHGCPTIGP
jgi:Rrf2 family cysteine metabolism transcriptional repressor